MAAQSLILSSRAVLFDFDGPLCSLFSGKPASRVARDLEAGAGERFGTDDPLEVLRLAFKKDPVRGAAVEDALIRAEIEAVGVADAELDGVQLLRDLHSGEKAIGIVSNNSAEAIFAFLERFDLVDAVTVVVGRDYRRPDRMKPDPWPLRQALALLGVDPHGSVMIGDSMTDIEVAARVGVGCVALANKTSKVAAFTASGVPTVTSMSELNGSA